ncbi:MAG: thioredoxin family protein [Gemmatimonadaceae bacterium]|nr:thioredoxin family protein [Gemmatimonadaceae bacterium]
MLDLKDRFAGGESFSALLSRPKGNDDLWNAVYKRAELDRDALDRLTRVTGEWHLLVLNEPWCGDSLNILPVIARLEEASSNIDMRMIGRDTNPDLMSAHLTGTSRSIPIVLVLDDSFAERGWWGPRPAALQRWVLEEGLALPKPDRYRHIRGWYARDRGKAVVSEILGIIEKSEGMNAPATH